MDVAIARRGYYQGLDGEQNRSCKIWIKKIQFVVHGLYDKRRIRLYMTRHDSQKQKGQGVRRGAYISNKSDLVKGRLRV